MTKERGMYHLLSELPKTRLVSELLEITERQIY